MKNVFFCLRYYHTSTKKTSNAIVEGGFTCLFYMIRIINPTIIIKPVKQRNNTYKKCKKLLVWCFIQEKSGSKIETRWELLHILQDSMEIYRIHTFWIKKIFIWKIPKNILKLLKWIREIKDWEREYIGK